MAVLFFWGVGSVQGRPFKQTYLEDTGYPLEVYRISGKKPGKTLMVIGGIQGDEAGGFLAADHYAEMSLKRGNLIIVPRANVPSIVENRRQIQRDMNRCFEEKANTEDYEGKVVEVLKSLMGESDILLNLHEGSGFYAAQWVSEERNPMRFGQSIIADAGQYIRKDGSVVNLEGLADQVVEKINLQISNTDHHFNFNNHRTFESDSPHKEQRNSATFYALTHHGIPSFGVETSKSLPIQTKVQHHVFAINAFMEILDISPEFPALRVDTPLLDYLVVSVEGYPSFVVKKNESLEVFEGAVLRITHIVANYTRGLSVRIDGFDRKNLLGHRVVIRKAARVRVFKDHEPCGSIALVFRSSPERPVLQTRKAIERGLSYQIRIDGNVFWISDGTVVDVPHGAIFEIVGVESGKIDPVDLEVNFKGFAPNVAQNTGEDRGQPIDTAKDLWLRYSEGGKGSVYPVVVSLKGEKIGGFKIRLHP